MNPPPALLALIATQPEAIRPLLIPVLVPHRQAWTIALKDDPTETLRSVIHDTQVADVRFDLTNRHDAAGDPTPNGCWEEGKPCVEESYTEYFVGDHKLEVPDDFSDRILRYQ